MAFGQRVLSVGRFYRNRGQQWWEDEAGWIEYHKSYLPDSLVFPLSGASTAESLAYYALLDVGLDLWPEYGWMCEYSTVGMPPQQRIAVATLLDADRIDLILDALRQGSPEGKVYAADALLYANQRGRPLMPPDRQIINQLRVNPDTITTCVGGRGSYKTNRTAIAELLSDESIATLSSRYDALKLSGWYQGGF
ncbi:MAG: hypothetical protein Rubg2KO_40290 [Rubricoccaceae bacterium]